MKADRVAGRPCGEGGSPALYHYVIVRADLPTGFAMAQVVHAAGESALGGAVPDGTNAVVLEARDEAHLREIFAKLEAKRLSPFLICEPDAPYHGQATAIGLPPRIGRVSLLSSLPLYGGAPRRRARAAAPATTYLCGCGETISTAPGAYCYTCNGGRRSSAKEVAAR